MLNITTQAKHREIFPEVVNLLENSKKFFERVGVSDMEKKVVEMRSQLDEPFYLLVAGEYNSGKSSFINAMCGEHVLADGPTPTTNRITLLTYGDKVEIKEVGDHLCQATYPMDSLRDVTLVDTPGTNSIIVEHAALTESFVHRAELVLFVTSADHPFTESERQFLQFLKGKWGRKVLFILNKIDLKTQEELDEIVTFLEKNCYRLLGFEPKILSVSAKEAYRAKVEGDETLLQKSKIAEVEAFVFDKLDLDTKIDFKLVSPLKYLFNVFGELQQNLNEKVNKCNTDIKGIERFETRLKNKKQDMREYTIKYKDEIKLVFARLKEKLDNFLNSYVTMKSVILSKVGREKINERFKREVYGLLNPQTDLDRIIDDVVDYVARNNRSLWDLARDHIEKEVGYDRRAGSILDGHAERHYDDRKHDIEVALKARSKEFRELDIERESERLNSSVQGGFVSFLLTEAFAIGIGVAVTMMFSFIVPPPVTIGIAVALASIGLVIFPQKRKSFRNEFVKRTDTICERFVEFMKFEIDKAIDRVIEDISNNISSYRDLRWTEREEMVRQVSEVNVLLENVKSLMRKSGLS
ncbi:MAG TPA: dynamin family protein [Candidatus Wujingus californicus]|uniref:dynamin family protein n=1 Tax=Candidatus Wujingus californicus TaxID=3367618 RepID=UPI001D269D73|nr:dynamin family protein [Planctomycetota bacterium]